MVMLSMRLVAVQSRVRGRGPTSCVGGFWRALSLARPPNPAPDAEVDRVVSAVSGLVRAASYRNRAAIWGALLLILERTTDRTLNGVLLAKIGERTASDATAVARPGAMPSTDAAGGDDLSVRGLARTMGVSLRSAAYEFARGAAARGVAALESVSGRQRISGENDANASPLLVHLLVKVCIFLLLAKVATLHQQLTSVCSPCRPRCWWCWL